jgi:hypothetical protein
MVHGSWAVLLSMPCALFAELPMHSCYVHLTCMLLSSTHHLCWLQLSLLRLYAGWFAVLACRDLNLLGSLSHMLCTAAVAGWLVSCLMQCQVVLAALQLN